MTNKRICDFCGVEIPKGTDYFKLQFIKHEGKKVHYIGKGHMCIGCYKPVGDVKC